MIGLNFKLSISNNYEYFSNFKGEIFKDDIQVGIVAFSLINTCSAINNDCFNEDLIVPNNYDTELFYSIIDFESMDFIPPVLSEGYVGDGILLIDQIIIFKEHRRNGYATETFDWLAKTFDGFKTIMFDSRPYDSSNKKDSKIALKFSKSTLAYNLEGTTFFVENSNTYK